MSRVSVLLIVGMIAAITRASFSVQDPSVRVREETLYLAGSLLDDVVFVTTAEAHRLKESEERVARELRGVLENNPALLVISSERSSIRFTSRNSRLSTSPPWASEDIGALILLCKKIEDGENFALRLVRDLARGTIEGEKKAYDAVFENLQSPYLPLRAKESLYANYVAYFQHLPEVRKQELYAADPEANERMLTVLRADREAREAINRSVLPIFGDPGGEWMLTGFSGGITEEAASRLSFVRASSLLDELWSPRSTILIVPGRVEANADKLFKQPERF